MDMGKTAKCALIYVTVGYLMLFVEILHARAQPTTDGTGSQERYPYANFSPSMAIIIVVLISALFLMGFLSVYIRHCTGSYSVADVRSIVGGQVRVRSRRADRGLDLAVIETFPTFPYATVKGLKIGKEALECAVCLNEFEDDEILRLLPKCDHVFHSECIDAWLSSHVTCPVCRANLAVESVPAGEGKTLFATIFNDLDESNESSEPTRSSELQNSVSIRVNDDQNGDDDRVQQVSGPVGIVSSRSMNQNRPPRSGSMKSFFFSKYPRSHSTGHSLVQPGENVERFTLKLPDDVRKQILNQTLDRTTSLSILPRETSSRRGYRLGGEVSRAMSYRRLESLDPVSKFDRWILTAAPPFLTKAPSVRSFKTTVENYEETSVTHGGFINSLKKSIGRTNSKSSVSDLDSSVPARQPV